MWWAWAVCAAESEGVLEMKIVVVRSPKALAGLLKAIFRIK